MDTTARREWGLESLTPRGIYERLSRYVIGQEDAKRAVAIAAYNHVKRIRARRSGRATALRKSNLLLIGPTGSGKTHIARTLAQVLSVPFATVDATEYTEAGYYGKDVEVMVADLMLRAHHVVEEAERGIIFIDEVDKIARRSQGSRNGAGGRDIGGEGVQQALLKLLEGREIYVPMNASQHWTKHDFVQVDTQDILFICAGTFSDLFRGMEEGPRALGFGAAERRAPRRHVTLKELIDFGMLAELMGRLPVVVQLEALGEAELMRVLTEPPDAVTREFQELLALDGIDLEFTREALQEIVLCSLGRGLGARGLRSILERVMSEVLFEAPEARQRTVKVDRGYVQQRLAGLVLAGM